VLIDVVGKATGVIDWGDAGTAPWWRDFTGIWMWGGDLALDAALRSYGKTLTQNERHWLYHHALLATVNDLEYNEALNLSAEVLHESSRRFRRALRALQRFASPGF
jgi:aminoglycoside phosphotransferase (APT) family kinase protein